MVKRGANQADDTNPRLAEVLPTLSRGTRSLAEAQSPEAVCRAVLRAAQAVTGADRVSVGIVDQPATAASSDGTAGADGKLLRLVATTGLPEEVGEGITVPLAGSLSGWVWEHRRPLLVQGASHRNPAIRARLLGLRDRSSACLPLVLHGQALGVLNVSVCVPPTGAGRPLRRENLAELQIIVNQAAGALVGARARTALAARATQDGLTGLLNYPAFQGRLAGELDRAGRVAAGLAFLLIGLDHFKQINEVAGNQVGDALLVAAAQAIRDSLRPYDVAARYGGDQFAVLLPQTNPQQALLVANRIRRAIAAIGVQETKLISGPLSASIGVAHFPTDAVRREDLTRVAEQALYFAKYRGRGRVERGTASNLALDSASSQDPVALRQALAGASHAVVEALAAAIDARDPYTAGHSRRVADYAARLARRAGLSDAQIETIRVACLFHDVGKIGVPDAILRKAGRLTDDEFREMQRHPVVGHQVLAAVPFLREGLPVVRHHHERWDGRGYPDRLAGTDIPLLARLTAIVDAYDAMSSTRVYRAALYPDDVAKIMRSGAGEQWDPELTKVWCELLAEGIGESESDSTQKETAPQVAAVSPSAAGVHRG